MELLQETYDSFYQWSDDTAREIAEWSNPGVVYDDRATRGWWGTHLSEALLWCAGYAVVVGIGLALRGPEKEAKKSPLNTWTQVFAAFNKEPIKYIQAVYNLVQVALCAFMITLTVLEYRANDYSPVCNPFKAAGTGISIPLWIFYLSKILDFLDTVFIVVRGKWRQLSFLHVYHHFSIFLFYWLNMTAGYDGDIYYTIIANGAIHLAMYWYYFCSMIGPKPSWAKYLTQMQMVQFITMMSQAIYIVSKECAYPRNITLLYLFYILSLFVLFNQFYAKRYTKKAKKD